ncbi:unnamed protein product [Bursaphelenchus xylophilus]|uniref:(pine wood nematode) hypothetical protein n=1 Tax=Bursaphelenchus xylophilus TaxID=6326 RepID=A0A1I7S4G8_BURXY|nr:unnamed protein product [Bursaphelenchus xylophilus]CAG9117073.1 unnamed protein product [Bursaphelenchus xylophilus]
MSDDDCCHESFITETSAEMRVAYILQVILNSAVSLLLLRAVRSRRERHVPAHPNFKILIANAAVATWTFTTFSALTSSILLFNSFRATPENCATLMSRSTCLLLRIPGSFPIPMFTSVHMMLFIERCVAFLMKSSYEKQMKIMGVTFTVIAWTFCFPFEFIMIGKVDPKEKVAHCVLSAKDAVPFYVLFLEITTLVDIGTTLGDLLLRCRARRSVRKTREIANFENYTLSKAYQRNENLRLMTMMVPISTVFAGGHFVFVYTALRIRSWLPVYARFRLGDDPSPEALGRLGIAVSELNMSVFLLLLFTVTRMYILMGEKLMNEKQATTNRPNHAVTFSLFEDQMNSHLMAKRRESRPISVPNMGKV